MKHITGTALRVAAVVVLVVTGLALLAGQDDIRRFHRMRSM
jgi:type IV secretory pathway VirB2 component (pilin)